MHLAPVFYLMNITKDLHLAHTMFDYLEPSLVHLGRIVGLGVGLAVGSSVLLQVLYPRSMTLPQTSIGGRSFGLTSQRAIEHEIAQLNDGMLAIRSNEALLSHRPAELGIHFSGTSDAKAATAYSWRERLTPFSFFTERRVLASYSYDLDDAKAAEFAASLAKYNKAPANAMVKLEGTKVVMERGATGIVYQPAVVTKDMHNLTLTQSLATQLEPEVVEPDIPDGVAEQAAAILRQRLSSPLTVSATDKSVVFDQPTIATWTQLTPDATDKKLTVTYDRAKVKAALAEFEKQVYVPATPKGVSMVDGVTVASTAGANGRALALEPTTDAILAALDGNSETAAAQVQAIPAPARESRGYTRSNKGMQALLSYWAQSNPGQWGVVMRDFNGTISAGVNPARPFQSVSIYKLYVGYVVYAKADSGQLSLQSMTSVGQSVGTCLEVMIVRSDNPCGEALGNMVGWSANDGVLRAQGFSGTSLAGSDPKTTAQDAATYMVKLQNGLLLAAGSRAAMLDKLGRNIYRFGIPAGSPGIYVADKVGNLNGYNHDVAIVYHPKGAYVLSVLSEGSSPAKIRELATQVRTVMDQ